MDAFIKERFVIYTLIPCFLCGRKHLLKIWVRCKCIGRNKKVFILAGVEGPSWTELGLARQGGYSCYSKRQRAHSSANPRCPKSQVRLGIVGGRETQALEPFLAASSVCITRKQFVTEHRGDSSQHNPTQHASLSDQLHTLKPWIFLLPLCTDRLVWELSLKGKGGSEGECTPFCGYFTEMKLQ